MIYFYEALFGFFSSVSDEEDEIEADSEDGDTLGSLNGRPCLFEDEETRSRFTEYSMSSSVMRRNQQLSLLDHRFEKVLMSWKREQISHKLIQYLQTLKIIIISDV